MTLPFARTVERDGALGNASNVSGLPMAVVGPCSAAASLLPQSFLRVPDLITALGEGPLVDHAAYVLDTYKRPVIVVPTGASEPHVYSAVDVSGVDGTSTPSVASPSTAPKDDYEVSVKVVAGGVVGTAGITYRISYDAGRSYAAPVALGTATTIPIAGCSGVALSAGSLAAGDVFTFSATAATPLTSELSAALDSLTSTGKAWEFAFITSPLAAADASAVATWLASLHAVGKHHWAAGNFRLPAAGETEADYLDAFEVFRATFSSTSLVVGAGAAKVMSPISRRQYRRPAMLPVAALISACSEEIDPAALDGKLGGDTGPLPGTAIRDAEGNPEAGYHDEAVNPGLDDLHATTLRTWDGELGVYVGNCRLMGSDDSDFQFVQARRVMNIARTVARAYMLRRLSKPLPISPRTGFVQEWKLREIEAGCNEALSKALLQKPKASAARVVLSRNDPVTTAPYPLTGQLKVVPLAYPKEITIEVSFAQTLEG